MRINVMTILSIAAISASVAFVAPATAQKQNERAKATAQTSSGGTDYTKPNCPITYVSDRCLPPKRLRKVASKEECSCEVIRVNSGSRTLWVRNCYVQLPDETVYYCKSPIHQPPRS
jgi:hypothetical protein